MEHIILPGIFTGSVWQIIGSTSIFGAFILATLAIMSFISWVIIFYKWREYHAVENDNSKFVQFFRRSTRLSESVGQAKSASRSPISSVFLTGYQDLMALAEQKNVGGGLQQTVQPLDEKDYEIIEMSMEKTLTDEMGTLEKKVIFLATTANVAPFMGLLGTVVGIMDSFWSIGQRGSASLAVVAPGIAEALLATIVGLGAAIPAVIAFNWATNKMKVLNDQTNSFILEFLVRIKKDNL